MSEPDLTHATLSEFLNDAVPPEDSTNHKALLKNSVSRWLLKEKLLAGGPTSERYPNVQKRVAGSSPGRSASRRGRTHRGYFNRASANSLDPQNAADFGDGFLMEQGFTLLWVGWQFDVAGRDGLLRVYVPSARETNGQSIQGLVRSDFTPTQPTADVALPDATYAVVDAKDPANALTVRDSVEAKRRTIPRDQWDFTADRKSIHLAAGFTPNKIYEVVYRSQDPPIAGLGPAAVRDTIAKLKYGSASELSVGQGTIKRAIAFGISQSGRFLRTYLYYGFNEDEGHRKVFDGVMSHVAGGGRGSFDNRFALPSRTAGPFSSFFYPVDIFPFTDVAQLDPETGKRDGLLTHNMKPEFMPKVMYTNSSHEYWGRAASLFTTTVDGKEDAPMMSNVRAYMYTGGNHGIAAFPPTRGSGQQLNDPLDYRWAARKLLVSLNRWIVDGAEPPPSAYPHISNGTFVTAEKVKFPKIPNLTPPTSTNIHKAYRVDYGPDFVSKGVISQEPPKVTSAFPMLVPQVDADGNDLPGIRMPEIAVPLATYLGWNFFNERAGPTTELVSLTGSMIPFARTRADRESAHDPRLSIEERYKSKDAYLDLITKSADDLATKGYVMKEDIPRIVEQAGTRWDWVMTR